MWFPKRITQRKRNPKELSQKVLQKVRFSGLINRYKNKQSVLQWIDYVVSVRYNIVIISKDHNGITSCLFQFNKIHTHNTARCRRRRFTFLFIEFVKQRRSGWLVAFTPNLRSLGVGRLFGSLEKPQTFMFYRNLIDSNDTSWSFRHYTANWLNMNDQFFTIAN